MRDASFQPLPGGALPARGERCVEVVRWTFPGVPLHARLARLSLAVWLEERWCPRFPEQVWAAVVSFSEVVTNAVRHGAGPITVHARLTDQSLGCEVTDRCVELPPLLDASARNEFVRARSLIDALTTRWAISGAPGGGKTTCFVIELSPRDGLER